MAPIYLLCLLLIVRHSTADDGIGNCVEAVNYNASSIFRSNLKLLLSSLSVLSTNSTFANITKGSGPYQAYGLFLCRGDISLSDCSSCVNTATQDALQICPSTSKQVTIWYDTCQLRYSDQSLFSSFGFGVEQPYPVSPNATDPATFSKNERELMINLCHQAAYNSTNLFATGEMLHGDDQQSIYGLVQCTRYLTRDMCSQCLNQLFESNYCCDGQIAGGVHGDSCSFRYNLTKFFEGEPDVSITAQTSSSPPAPSPGNRNVIIISVVISIVIVLQVIFVLRILFRRRPAQNSYGMANPGEISRTDSLYFDLSILKVATANFSDVNKLGQGGFGAVYRGMLPNGEDIAVKRLSANSRQGIEELKNELLLVAKLHHRNLVRLRGVCLEEGEKLLVYEYMPNGSLDKFLFDPDKRKEFNWERRFKIIRGIARGLLYLHEESNLKVIHRDLKASNVLLDANVKPKISDFGLARLFEGDETHVITYRVVGTFGYMAPEYARRGRLSTKLDVYSYGILVLEIVTGRKNSAFKYDSDHGQDLLCYVWKHWRSGTALEIIDKSLGEDYSRTEAFRCIQIGLLCVQEVPFDRPSMYLVFLMLNSPSLPLQDPLPPAYLAGLITAESEVSSMQGWS